MLISNGKTPWKAGNTAQASASNWTCACNNPSLPKGEMSAMKPIRTIAAIAIIAFVAVHARAGDILTLKIPRHSELTPVQRLNREGVEAVKKMNYGKASALFYKAYLYDPSDPFTLNNLGYVSELQGELDQAQKFYALASEQGCDANIDVSNAKQLQGKPMQYAFANLQNSPMRVNRMNINAMEFICTANLLEL